MRNKYLLFLILFVGFIVASAHSARAESPIEIEADETVYNQKEGTSVYRGNVKITSDNLTLYGKEVKFFSQDGEVARIVSTKPPSRFVQSGTDGNINAKANHIEYIITKQIIHLSGDVRIKDGDKTFIGEDAIYNTKTQTFSSRKEGERIKLIINPKKN